MRLLLALVLALMPASAMAGAVQPPAGRAELVRIMDSLKAQNLDASAQIHLLYTQFLELLVLDQYGDVEAAVGNGGLVPLPDDPARLNILLRTAGEHPIGEKDLARQASYLSARTATIGCLLDVASHVRSGPIEVTSLVRHSDYQDELRGSNANAITSIPMHTMGLAFDIALINSPIETVRETLDTLIQMRDAGEIFFIGERQQLVFHVVPRPSKLGYFDDVYLRHAAASMSPIRALWVVPPVVDARVVAYVRSPRQGPIPLPAPPAPRMLLPIGGVFILCVCLSAVTAKRLWH